MSRCISRHLILAAGLLALAGCDQLDPQLKTDAWRPTGANAGNIAAMVADPHDLISGHGTMFHDVHAPALAVDHLWLDQPKPLVSSTGGSGGGGASPSGSTAPSGGGTGSGSSGSGS